MNREEKTEQWEKWKENNDYPEEIKMIFKKAKDTWETIGYRNTKSKGHYIHLETLFTSVVYMMYDSNNLNGNVEDYLRLAMHHGRPGQRHK